jgi:hypothetical protein
VSTSLVRVNIIGPYTLKGKDGTEIDFMCLTMIDPASSLFELVELLVVKTVTTPLDYKKGNKKGTRAHKHKQPTEDAAYFDISSAMTSTLVNKTWFSRYPQSTMSVYYIQQQKQVQTQFQSLM